MRIQVLSDLHIEFQPFEPPRAGADVIILAGDIHVGAAGVAWALEHIRETPVIYVLGNHEYYRHKLPDLCVSLKEKTQGTHVHVLENNSIVINDVRFLGCTLWTDFRLNGNPVIAGFDAERMLADYNLIRVSPAFRKLKAVDTVALHRRSKAWLNAELPRSDLPTVVVTHHAPATASIAEQYKSDNSLNPAFVSDMGDFVAGSGARYWIHGHTHSRFDYTLGTTRVLCNPRGYAHEPGLEFDPSFTVEI
jgi:predicted MPP superfamily phosphohydrolase